MRIRQALTILLLAISTVLIVDSIYRYLNLPEPTPTERYREYLVDKTKSWPKAWITDQQRSEILLMLNQVLTIEPMKKLESPNDFGGGIGGLGFYTLFLSPVLLESEGFQVDRVLRITLGHETIHWQQLKTGEYSRLKNGEISRKSLEAIAMAAKMEVATYTHDYEVTKKLHALDPAYKMPTCFVFINEVTHEPINPTAQQFGYGRALFSMFTMVKGFEDKTIDEKWDIYFSSLKLLQEMSPEYKEHHGLGPINCKDKNG